MTSLERTAKAMRLERPDRVPLMCQPSWGFVLQQMPEIDPVGLWYNEAGIYPRSFCDISHRFHFDGVLIPAVGLALLTHPGKCSEILMRFADAVSGHVQEQIDAGVDAMNLSAPWSGQNFISTDLYVKIIAPAQKVLADLCSKNNVISYCHTCGAIDDRLELIVDIGFDGIECLDPPPMGNVELEDAVRRIGDRAFIKGNIDPVNVLKNGTAEQVRRDVIQRIETGMRAKGFILSTACSMAPGTPPENIDLLYELVEKYGYY